MKIFKQFILRRKIEGYPFSGKNHSILPEKPTCAGKQDYYRLAVQVEPGEKIPKGKGKVIEQQESSIFVGKTCLVDGWIISIHPRKGDIKCVKIKSKHD